jgi:hypothetical protein
MRNGSSDEGTLAGNGDYKASYVHGINSRRKNVSKVVREGGWLRIKSAIETRT